MQERPPDFSVDTFPVSKPSDGHYRPGHPMFFKHQEYGRWKDRFADSVRTQWIRDVIKGPVGLTAEILFGDDAGRVKDCDNMVGPIQDAIQKVVYWNDNQVSRL